MIQTTLKLVGAILPLYLILNHQNLFMEQVTISGIEHSDISV